MRKSIFYNTLIDIIRLLFDKLVNKKNSFEGCLSESFVTSLLNFDNSYIDYYNYQN